MQEMIAYSSSEGGLARLGEMLKCPFLSTLCQACLLFGRALCIMTSSPIPLPPNIYDHYNIRTLTSRITFAMDSFLEFWARCQFDTVITNVGEWLMGLGFNWLKWGLCLVVSICFGKRFTIQQALVASFVADTV